MNGRRTSRVATLAASSGVRLAVRAGIHTGLALGDTRNVAARVQAPAERGTVGITAATNRLVPGLFVVEDIGVHALKGVREPARLYRVWVSQAEGWRPSSSH